MHMCLPPMDLLPQPNGSPVCHDYDDPNLDKPLLDSDLSLTTVLLIKDSQTLRWYLIARRLILTWRPRGKYHHAFLSWETIEVVRTSCCAMWAKTHRIPCNLCRHLWYPQWTMLHHLSGHCHQSRQSAQRAKSAQITGKEKDITSCQPVSSHK